MMFAFHDGRDTSSLPEMIDEYEHVAQPRHPDGKILLDYWQHCVDQHGDFVVGRDIPSRMIARLLSSVVVSEPVDGGANYRIRLAGTSVRRRFGDEIGGRMLSDMFSPEDFAHHLADTNLVLQTGKPLVVDSRLRRGVVEELHSEVVLLPVKSPDGTQHWSLVGVFYFE